MFFFVFTYSKKLIWKYENPKKIYISNIFWYQWNDEKSRSKKLSQHINHVSAKIIQNILISINTWLIHMHTKVSEMEWIKKITIVKLFNVYLWIDYFYEISIVKCNVFFICILFNFMISKFILVNSIILTTQTHDLVKSMLRIMLVNHVIITKKHMCFPNSVPITKKHTFFQIVFIYVKKHHSENFCPRGVESFRNDHARNDFIFFSFSFHHFILLRMSRDKGYCKQYFHYYAIYCQYL